MALSNAQLLMLDNLIYTNYVSNGSSVRDIITEIENADYNVSCCEMSSEEWKELVAAIKEENQLLDYKVQNYVNDKNTGMRAACFVDDIDNPQDVNVVFRGTASDYEWHDNGEGGYLSDTNQQIAAAEYVNNLPEAYGNNLTVTGHSKGGNKAQYVTITTDRVLKCVSFDGQGFSEEFVEKYKDEITKKANSIVSISAADDFVNPLLYTIAGQRIYIETENQKNFTHYHKPNILLDSNGNLRDETEQSDLSKLINAYTTYMVSNLEEPERSITIDGLIALLEKGEDKEHILQTIYAGGNAITHLDDFAFDWIGDKYGYPVEVGATYIAAVICPYLFYDDFKNCQREAFEYAVDKMFEYADEIAKKFNEYGEKAAEFGKKFIDAVSTFVDQARDWFSKKVNVGYKYASDNPYIELNTATLRAYADRLTKVNTRLSNLDKRLDNLYWRIGLQDIWNLLQADLMTGYSWRIANCAKYLNETATDFENTERDISSLF